MSPNLVQIGSVVEGNRQTAGHDRSIIRFMCRYLKMPSKYYFTTATLKTQSEDFRSALLPEETKYVTFLLVKSNLCKHKKEKNRKAKADRAREPGMIKNCDTYNQLLDINSKIFEQWRQYSKEILAVDSDHLMYSIF